MSVDFLVCFPAMVCVTKNEAPSVSFRLTLWEICAHSLSKRVGPFTDWSWSRGTTTSTLKPPIGERTEADRPHAAPPVSASAQCAVWPTVGRRARPTPAPSPTSTGGGGGRNLPKPCAPSYTLSPSLVCALSLSDASLPLSDQSAESESENSLVRSSSLSSSSSSAVRWQQRQNISAGHLECT
jgi:hypothetical protein